mgnify:CR=1 FL=1|tara:strand:- start:545 stop:2251 length:1707 start_codon:yes stop_codon:yes gene_type:complete
MSVKKTLGIKAYNIMMGHLTRKKIPQTAIKTADEVKQPPVKEEISDREAINAFMKRNPKADGGRAEFSTGRNVGKTSPVKTEVFKYPRTNRFGTVYSDTPAGGIRRNIINEKTGKEIIEKFKKGFSSVELEQEYGFDNDTILDYIKKKEPDIKVAKADKRRLNQYNFDKSVIDEIVADAPNMSRKMILKKYGDRISKKKLDSLKLKFGIVEESGRPRVAPGERSPKQVKRVNRIRNAQGFDVSGTFEKNFHHIFPIGGLSKLSAKDVMILDKKFNERLGGFNLQLNDIADEIGSLDLSDPNAVKKLNDLNAKSKNLVDRAKAKLPKNLKNAIGYIEYQPVFDENGTIFELSQVRKGVDKNPSQLAKFGDKKFKDYSVKEKQNFKKEVKRVANLAENRGLMMAANPMFSPGVLREAFKSIPTPLGAVGLTAGFGVDPTSAIDRAGIAAEAAFAPALVKQSAKMGAAQRLFNLGFNPRMAMRIARIASPLGIASLGAEGLYQAGKFTKKRIGELKAMTPEQRQNLRAQQEALAFEGARDGGLIGDKSGPAPESGPQPQGLPGIYKRGKKL